MLCSICSHPSIHPFGEPSPNSNWKNPSPMFAAHQQQHPPPPHRHSDSLITFGVCGIVTISTSSTTRRPSTISTTKHKVLSSPSPSPITTQYRPPPPPFPEKRLTRLNHRPPQQMSCADVDKTIAVADVVAASAACINNCFDCGQTDMDETMERKRDTTGRPKTQPHSERTISQPPPPGAECLSIRAATTASVGRTYETDGRTVGRSDGRTSLLRRRRRRQTG